MTRLSRSVLCGCVMLGGLLVGVGPAGAIEAFKKEFENLYVKPDGNETEKALAEAYSNAKCDVCHQGKDKKKRNAYGVELAKLLKKARDGKDAAKIQKSLKAVEAKHSDPKDKKSPTFGELIQAGKLPGAGK